MSDEKSIFPSIPKFCVFVMFVYIGVLIYSHFFLKELLDTMTGIGPVIVSTLICFLLRAQLKKDLEKDPQGESLAPTLMVAQGTFFTFLGVSYILYTYDPANADVSSLLGGLKLAFVTSLIGLFFSVWARAIAFKAKQQVSRRSRKYDDTQIDERDIYAELKNISALLVNMKESIDKSKIAQEKSTSLLENLEENINESIAGNNDFLQQNMINVSRAMLDNVDSCFEEIKTTTAETSAILQEIKEHSKGISRSSSNIDRHFQSMEVSAEATDAKFNSIKEYLGGTMVSAKEYADATTKAMDTAAVAISKVSTINDTFAQNAMNISNAVNSIESSSTNIGNTLARVQAVSTDVSEAMDKIARTVGEYSALNAKLVDTLKDSDMVRNVESVAEMEARLSNNIQGQMQVVEAIASSLVSLKESLHDFDVQVNRLNGLQEYMDKTFNNSTIFAKAFENGAKEVGQAFSKLSEELTQASLNQLNTYTKNVSDEMRSAHLRYQEHVVKAQEPFVAAITKSINVLNSKIESKKDRNSGGWFR